jgi:hypothetical protein
MHTVHKKPAISQPADFHSSLFFFRVLDDPGFLRSKTGALVIYYPAHKKVNK